VGDRPAGWYADPVTVGAARYWDGREWTDEVAWGGRVIHDPTPLDRVRRRAARVEADTIVHYLDDAVDRHVTTPAVADQLRHDVERLALGAPSFGGRAPVGRTAMPTAPGDSALGAPPSPGRPMGTSPAVASRPAAESVASDAPPRESFPAPSVISTPRIPRGTSATSPPEPIPSEPGRMAIWWRELGEAIKSDLAMHGIAYLGALLMFTGVTGLIAFSFGSVTPWVRTLTELAVPASLLIAGWYLARRGADVVGRSLIVLGGAMTPIVVAASLTDGAPVPPDVDGAALPIAQGSAVAVVAAAMAVCARREPHTPLRFLVAPIAWMAVGLAVGVARDPIPQSYQTVRAEPIQLAAVMLAIAMTAVLVTVVRGHDESPLRTATATLLLPAAGIVYVLELVAAGAHGWPTTAAILAGIGLGAIAESSVARLTDDGTAVLQYLAVAVGAARLTVALDPSWVAVGTASIMLVLYERTGRRGCRPAVVAAGAALSGAAFAWTLTDRLASVVAFSLLTAWGLWRHVRPVAWNVVADRLGLIPAVASLLVVGATWELATDGAVMTATAAVIVGIAIAGRVWHTMAVDVLWRWFVPAASGAIAASSLTYRWGDVPVATAATAVLAAIAIGLSGLAPWIRLWSSGLLLLWAGANAGEHLDLGTSTQLLVLGTGGAVIVLGALAVGRPIAAHAAAMGHLMGIAALGACTSVDLTATVLAGTVALAWLATAVVDDRREAIHLAAARDLLRPDVGAGTDPTSRMGGAVIDHLAPVATACFAAVTAAFAAVASGWTTIDSAWNTSAVAGVAVIASAVTRLVPLRRARPAVLGWAWFVLASLAVTAALPVTDRRGDWSVVVTIGLALAVVVLARSPRPTVFGWVWWSAALGETILVADRVGVAREWLDAVAAGWGAVVLIGVLVRLRLLDGASSAAAVVHDRVLAAPAIVGAAALSVGGVLAVSDGSRIEIGWSAAGLSLAVAAIAVLGRYGALIAVAQILATAAIGLLAPWDPMDRPWTWTPWAVVLLLLAQAVRRDGPWSFARWDLPSFAAAHVVAAIALIAAFGADAVAATYAAFAVVSFGIAGVLRRREWAVAGGILLAVSAEAAGPGWSAAVLGLEGLASTALGLWWFERTTDRTRWAMFGTGAALLVLAWFELTVRLGWDMQAVWFATVPTSAAVSFAAAVAWRRAWAPMPFTGVWTIGGAGVSVVTAAFGAAVVDRQPGGIVLASSLVTIGAAAGVLAARVDGALRWVSAAVISSAWLPLVWGLDVSAPASTFGGTLVGVIGTGVLVLTHGRRPRSPWVWPGGMFAILTQVGAATAAVSLLPDRGWTVVVLLAASTELTGLGVASGRGELVVAAPPVACGAWLLFIGDSLRGEPNWFTVPIGLTLLVMAAEVRWIRRARGGAPAAWEIVVLEAVGMAFLVGSALALELAGDLWYGPLAIGIGVLIGAWGVMTKVTWRAGFGASVVIAATGILLGVPLVQTITWTGPVLWAALAAAGIVAIAIASVLERRHDELRDAVVRLSELTGEWERPPTSLGGGVRRGGADRSEPDDPRSNAGSGSPTTGDADATRSGGRSTSRAR
jgi:hypothetical protein